MKRSTNDIDNEWRRIKPVMAELKGVSKQEMSIMLNNVEWSAKERNETMQLIRDNAVRR